MLPSPVLLPNRKGEQPHYFFSPAFQCYTSPPFYKNLLHELQYVSNFIDKCDTSAREIVWNQLFILLGAKRGSCSKVFSPILKAWAAAPTVNLLAIELLYLAFAISMDKYPDLIKDVAPNLQPKTASLAQQRVQTLQRLNEQQNLQNRNELRNSMDRLNNNYSSSSPSMNPSSSSPISNHLNKSPLPSQSNTSQSQSQSNTPQPQSQSNQTPSKVAFDFEKLIKVQAWKESLDKQPDFIKTKIWKVWESLTGLNSSNYANCTFTEVINSWAMDIASYSDSVVSFYNTVQCLKSTFTLDLDNPPSNNANSNSNSNNSNTNPNANVNPNPNPNHTHNHNHNHMHNNIQHQKPQEQMLRKSTGPSHLQGINTQRLPSPTRVMTDSMFRNSFGSVLPSHQFTGNPLGTISRTLRPPNRDVYPSMLHKRPLPPPAHFDAKKMKH